MKGTRDKDIGYVKQCSTHRVDLSSKEDQERVNESDPPDGGLRDATLGMPLRVQEKGELCTPRNPASSVKSRQGKPYLQAGALTPTSSHSKSEQNVSFYRWEENKDQVIMMSYKPSRMKVIIRRLKSIFGLTCPIS